MIHEPEMGFPTWVSTGEVLAYVSSVFAMVVWSPPALGCTVINISARLEPSANATGQYFGRHSCMELVKHVDGAVTTVALVCNGIATHPSGNKGGRKCDGIMPVSATSLHKPHQ